VAAVVFWMWGIPGAILSVPMLATTKIICDRIRPLAAFGHFLEGVKPSLERTGCIWTRKIEKIDLDEKEQRDNVEYPLGTTTALFEALGILGWRSNKKRSRLRSGPPCLCRPLALNT
jgi:hypothetical protein